jgi:hypothetical protein
MNEPTFYFETKKYVDGFTSQVTHEGLMRLEADAVVLEWRETRTELSTYQSEQTGSVERSIPLALLDSVEVRPWPQLPLPPRLLGGMFELRTRSLAVLDDVPGCRGNIMRVRLPRSRVAEARSFAAAVDNALADRALRRLGELPDDTSKQ